MQRRLAAILIADVTGYGRLSEANEEQTRAQFQSDLKDILGQQSPPTMAAWSRRQEMACLWNSAAS
jgi:hypothetical protein